MKEALECLWPGRLRKPVCILMVASIVATAILVCVIFYEMVSRCLLETTLWAQKGIHVEADG